MRRRSFVALFFFSLSFATSLPAEENKTKGTVYIFVDTVCPIANAYLPELGRIHKEYAKDGIEFRLVYPDKRITNAEISAHLSEYECSIVGVTDASHRVVKKAGVTATPEVAVFNTEGELCYRGRIDNLYTDLGDRRRQATEFYLRDVLTKVRNGETVEFFKTEPVGCIIEPLD